MRAKGNYKGKKTYRRKKITIKKQLRMQTGQVFRRIVSLGTVGCNALGFLGYGATFQLSDVPNSTDFTNLFDQYRLVKVVFRMRPYAVEQSFPVSGGALAPVYSCIDLDNVVIPGNTDQIREYRTCKSHSAVKAITRVIYPKPSLQLYNSPTTSGYAIPAGRIKISTSNASVPHYGVRVAAQFNNVTTANAYAYTIEAEYYITCYNAK